MDSCDWSSVLQFTTEGHEMQERKYQEHFDASKTPPVPQQFPTPPRSNHDSPVQEDSEISVSTTFFPGALTHALPTDLALVSSDSVFFYVHSFVLLNTSDNGFNALIPSQTQQDSQHPVIDVPELSSVLNIILHTVYDMSSHQYSPSFETLKVVVAKLPFYGISLKKYVSPSMPLYTSLAAYAPLFPLDLYALASSYDLFDLAQTTSPHLLSLPLWTITDEIAEQIGPVYLKRLFFLHFGRADALKRVLLHPPHPHPPTATCDFSDQKSVTRAWALATAYLAWDARPGRSQFDPTAATDDPCSDLPTSTIESSLRPLADHISCEDCKQCFYDRIDNLIVQWSIVKRTI